ncbi:MAG: calcium-binding protein [Methylococcaceae bacterium]|nr:calcium-binding protein [Methylococcaceae bacterium]
MTGGDGSDTFTIDNAADTVTDAAADGDLDIVNIGTFTTAPVTAVTFDFSGAGDGVENINILNAHLINVTANGMANIINGNALANVINAGAGIDTINAGGGNDTITGGAGKDTVITGTGNDKIVFNAGVADTVAAAASIAGVDKYTDLVLNAGTADTIDLTVAVANVGCQGNRGIE